MSKKVVQESHSTVIMSSKTVPEKMERESDSWEFTHVCQIVVVESAKEKTFKGHIQVRSRSIGIQDAFEFEALYYDMTQVRDELIARGHINPDNPRLKETIEDVDWS
jgi:hypothetical protein